MINRIDGRTVAKTMGRPYARLMTWLLVLLAVLVVMAAAVLDLVRKQAPKGPQAFPFEQCRPLTEREQVLYWRLRNVLPDEIVLAQVALSRILRVRKGHGFRSWLNRVDRMTVDFLVCLPDATIVAVVELDDASDGSPVRILADDRKTRALQSAGIKLLRYANVPDEAQLRKAFLE
jgi:very-short-patch-repair endonuclease